MMDDTQDVKELREFIDLIIPAALAGIHAAGEYEDNGSFIYVNVNGDAFKVDSDYCSRVFDSIYDYQEKS